MVSLMSQFYDTVVERMMRYARVNTQSSNNADSYPTTVCQRDLALILEKELHGIGASEVYYDEQSYIVYAKVPATVKNAASVGLIAHMDTAPDASGAGVKPWLLKEYNGGDIVLNNEKGIVMHSADYDNLAGYIGEDLILTDGTTLLGGDDKAAISSIMTAAEYLIDHPEIPHGDVCLAFTPDEEVGGLARDLDFDRFGSDTAYTIDGDHLGYYEYETFNASEAIVEIFGLSVHPATAKGIMINASDVAVEFLSSLPATEKPQYTEGREGFYYVTSIDSSCEYAKIRLIIRDFYRSTFENREEYLRKTAACLNNKYGKSVVSVTIKEQYRNMGEIIENAPHLVTNLKRAIEECGIEPVCEPFRGGTDGSSLSFRGLPCPNLSAGYENAHGRFEFVPVCNMEKNVEIILKLCEVSCNTSVSPSITEDN